MITRNAPKVDINNAFYGVKEEKLYYEGRNHKMKTVSGSKALIDVAEDKKIAIVSDRYRLISNREAYRLADKIVRGVFEGKTLNDFICFNIYMPSTKASCRIDLILPHNYYNPFGDMVEDWTPFVRISNSYNGTLCLKYEIGFCRWICKNGVIFDQKGLTISFTHTEILHINTFDYLIKRARLEIGEIGDVWNEFQKKLNALKNTTLPRSSALPMFCKVFNIQCKDFSDRQKDLYGCRASQIMNASKEYFNDMGNNAYALFNVLTDYASFPAGPNAPGNVHGYQKKIGQWADAFIAASKRPDFSLAKYIGNEAYDAANYLESLIQ